MEELIGFVALILGVVVFLWFILLPFNMARTRGRCGLCWLIASIFITTIGAIILLALIGDTINQRYKKMHSHI